MVPDDPQIKKKSPNYDFHISFLRAPPTLNMSSWRIRLAWCAGIEATQGLFGIIGPQLASYTGMMCWHRGNSGTIWDHRASAGVLYWHDVLTNGATQGPFGTIGPQLAYYTGMMCWHRGSSGTIWDHRASAGVLYRHDVLASGQLKDYLGPSSLSSRTILACCAGIGATQGPLGITGPQLPYCTGKM